MAAQTPVCDFGRPAPNFALRGVDGKVWSLDDVRGERGTLIMFICNHCPYVKSAIKRIVDDVEALKIRGIGAAAIMPNDVAAYPEDSFINMRRFAAEHKLNFPYLFDDTQSVARAYGAVCTPDFFGYNAQLKLHYRGRLDEGGREEVPGARRDLLLAMREIAETGQGPREQIASIGCSVKWRA